MSSRLVDCAALAEQLHAARRGRRAIAPPAEFATLTLIDAYTIQARLATRREADGTPQSGWKLGLTSGVKQRGMGIDHPLFGRIFADGALMSGDRIARAAFIAPRAEPELAIGLAAPLDPDATPEALMRAIAWIAPALEITDSRYLPGTRTAVELVADNTSAAAFVIGEHVAIDAAPPLDTIATELLRNGTVIATGVSADVLGHPLNALTLLAAHLARHDTRTRAGDVILSGAITDASSAAPGDRFEVRLRGLGSATIFFD